MAHLYQRGDVYWVKWYDPPKVPHFKSLGTADPKEAKALVKEIEAKLARGTHLVLPGGSPFDEVLTEFLKDKRLRREEWTAKTYEKQARTLRRLFPVQTRIGSIEPGHITRYLEARMAEGVSRATLNKERTMIKIVFNWAIRRDLAERNPAERTEAFSVRPKERRDVSEEDFKGLVDGR